MNPKINECLEMDLRKVWKLLHGRRAVSMVLSSVILMSAVVAVSFVWFVWTQYLSSVYIQEYGEAADAYLARLKEMLVFEYVFYDWSDRNLNVYLMNGGTINHTTVKTVYITNSIGEVIKVFSNITLMDFNGDEIADQDLDRGEEGSFTLSSLEDLVAETSYALRVVTGRGSTFHHTFTTYLPTDSTLLLYVDADDETKTDWIRIGTNPYLDTIDYDSNYVYAVGNNRVGGDFGFMDSGRSTGTTINVTVQVYATNDRVGDSLEVFVWDGSTWASLGLHEISTSWGWVNWDATTILDTWTKIDEAKMYFISRPQAGAYTIKVDCARLAVGES